jgi:hypothetical protein
MHTRTRRTRRRPVASSTCRLAPGRVWTEVWTVWTVVWTVWTVRESSAGAKFWRKSARRATSSRCGDSHKCGGVNNHAVHAAHQRASSRSADGPVMGGSDQTRVNLNPRIPAFVISGGAGARACAAVCTPGHGEHDCGRPQGCTGPGEAAGESCSRGSIFFTSLGEERQPTVYHVELRAHTCLVTLLGHSKTPRFPTDRRLTWASRTSAS